MKKAILSIVMSIVMVVALAVTALGVSTVSFTVNGVSCSGGVSFYSSAGGINPFDSDSATARTNAGSSVSIISASARLMSGSSDVAKSTVTNYDATSAEATASKWTNISTGAIGVHNVTDGGVSSGDKNTGT